MCGIAGLFVGGGDQRERLEGSVTPMALALEHRGPDDQGTWIDPENGIALAFRRLAIIDVSPAGRQPMVSASGRYVMIFNGEVYNFEDLRSELQAAGMSPRYRGHSDTEVLLAAFEAWGIEESVPRFNGMFAFAVWDRDTRSLSLVRDRVGVKPLYYGWADGVLLFASELKAIASYPGFQGAIDRNALAEYARYGYVPSPHSIYENVRKLEAGTIATFDRQGQHVRAYWTLSAVAEGGKANPFAGTDEDALNELERIVSDSVRLRMIADVPLGVFLSGGIDSSLVTALMTRQQSGPVETFAIGFDEPRYNEAPHAAAVARALGTNHRELIVTAADAQSVIPSLPSIFDEPFADSSLIPTYLVSKLARRHVTVSLSGDGGDEFFGGYDHYTISSRLWPRVERTPMFARRIGSAALRAVPTSLWNRASRKHWLPEAFRSDRAGMRIHKFARAMRSSNPDMLYSELTAAWTNVVAGAEDKPLDARRRVPEVLADFRERMMYSDQVSSMQDDILVKVDRASMAVSLEAREPLLDHRLMEFAWRLPMEMKIRDGQGKWLLRRLLWRYVDPRLIERPKSGFAIPLDLWLRGPLRDWAASLLDPARLRSEGFFHAGQVRKTWEEHARGEADWQRHLWIVLMFQSWMDFHRSAASDARARARR